MSPRDESVYESYRKRLVYSLEDVYFGLDVYNRKIFVSQKPVNLRIIGKEMVISRFLGMIFYYSEIPEAFRNTGFPIGDSRIFGRKISDSVTLFLPYVKNSSFSESACLPYPSMLTVTHEKATTVSPPSVIYD